MAISTNYPSNGNSGQSLNQPLKLWGGLFWVVVAIICFVAYWMFVTTNPRRPAIRSICTNNIRQIVLAILNYEMVNGHYPPAYTVDAEGNRLHSWRTLILPYLVEGNAFDLIDFSKPWNHPVNASLGISIPDVYRCPSDTGLASEDPTTSYIGIIGDETIWRNGGQTGTLQSEIKDGLSNTICIIESKANRIHWMAPNDLQFAAIPSQENLPRSQHQGGFNAGFADGSVRFLSESLSNASIKAGLTIAGGEIVEFD